jgi:hypothetical protein
MQTNDIIERPVPDDEAIHALVKRLSRPHPSGGHVIERAAILAEGADSSVILRWIARHAGEPDAPAPATSGGGLHSAPSHDPARGAARVPLRYVLPPGALA